MKKSLGWGVYVTVGLRTRNIRIILFICDFFFAIVFSHWYVSNCFAGRPTSLQEGLARPGSKLQGMQLILLRNVLWPLTLLAMKAMVGR